MPNDRRKAILKILDENNCVKGCELAERLGVTRQVIVKDIAIMRASGADIIATPNGYFLNKGIAHNEIKKVFAIKHGKKDISRELDIIIENGGIVADVVVEHPVYGEIQANLMLETKKDVRNFLEKIKNEEAKPLSSLTGGIHLHTVLAQNIRNLEEIEAKLNKEGFIVN